jgi:TonB-dependent starch-binding outer membrane protein SusC
MRRIFTTRPDILLWVMVFSFLASAGSSMAQHAVIGGKVTSDLGDGLPGVNVVIKNSSKGTTTDADGSFTMAGVNPEDVLVFSSSAIKPRR